MNKRTYVLLGALFLLLIIAGIVNYRYFRTGSVQRQTATMPLLQPQQKDPAKPASTKKEGDTGMPPPIKFEPIQVDTTWLERRLATGQWGREPFLTVGELKPPPIQEKPTVEEKPKTLEPEVPLTLTSILISEGQRVAIINDTLYSIGELVKETGERVSAITAEGVWLDKAGSGRLIQLKQKLLEVKSKEQ